MQLSTAMIVRDAEDTLEACIASVRPHVDEINIYLAGESTDGTVALVERLAAEPGAPIWHLQGSWSDDFAAARDRSFEMVSPEAEWVFWLDADDVLVGGRHLRTAIAAAGDTDAVELGYHHLAYGRHFTQSKRRLLRRSANWSWVGPVHEELVASRSVQVTVVPVGGPPVVAHTKTDWLSSAERNLRIARSDPDAYDVPAFETTADYWRRESGEG